MMDDIDRDLAIRTVLSEASNQGPDGMAAVAAVIKNRTLKGKYGGKSPAEVVTARNQFEPWNHAGKGKPNDPLSYAPGSPKYEEAAQIVDGVFSGAIKDPTSGATHFYSPSGQAKLAKEDGRALVPSWAKGKQALKIGDHMFYSPDDPNGGDLGQGMGAISQTPQVTTPPTQLPGAIAAGGAGGGNTPVNPLLAILQGGGQKASPQHGALNQLLFGPQGWQSHLGKAMPNGILGAMFGGGAGGGGASPSPAGGGGGGGGIGGLLAALGGGGGAPGGNMSPGAPMQPVANPDAPLPPMRPPELTSPTSTGGPAPMADASGALSMGGGGPSPSGPPAVAMAGAGGLPQMGGMGGGAGGGFMDVLKSLFSIG